VQHRADTLDGVTHRRFYTSLPWAINAADAEKAALFATFPAFLAPL
jgi:hypothetical protein